MFVIWRSDESKIQLTDLSILSPSQYNFVISPEPNVNLMAVAGSGKTFCAEMRIRYWMAQGWLPKSVCLMSFNKFIQEEWASKKLPIAVKTAHALGYAILRQISNPGDIVVSKYRDLGGLNRDESAVLDQMRRDFLFNELEKNDCLGHLRNRLIAADQEEKRAMVLYNTWRRGISAHTSTIDYQDMISIPLELIKVNEKYKDKIKSTFDLIIIDEVQDFTKHQTSLVKLLNPKNIWILGDIFQCINQFAGASHENAYDLRDVWNCTTFKLNYSRRCSKEIAGLVRSKFVSDFKPLPSAIQGRVNFAYAEMSGLEPIKKDDLFSENTAIISRWNAQLVDIGLTMMIEGIPFTYKKDISKNIIIFIKKIVGRNQNAKTSTLSKLIENYTVERYVELGDIAMSKSEIDLIEITKVFTQDKYQEKYPTYKDLFGAIMRAAKGKNGIVLTTIHGAKGLEWDNVITIDFNIVEKIAIKMETEMPENTELNCLYVGYTRAKKNLVLKSKDGFLESLDSLVGSNL